MWSWALSAIGLTGLYLAGSGKPYGWLFGVGAQVPWVIYSVVTEQYGFIVASLCYAGVYFRNWRRALRARR